jgi:arylsulfatase A-like enzyme
MYYPDLDTPNLPPGHLENLPAAARTLRERHNMAGRFTEDEVRRTRAAYYGMIKSRAWKLCYGHVPDGPPQLELYDHGTDPGEFVNLADRAEHAARRDAMVSEPLAE